MASTKRQLPDEGDRKLKKPKAETDASVDSIESELPQRVVLNSADCDLGIHFSLRLMLANFVFRFEL